MPEAGGQLLILTIQSVGQFDEKTARIPEKRKVYNLIMTDDDHIDRDHDNACCLLYDPQQE